MSDSKNLQQKPKLTLGIKKGTLGVKNLQQPLDKMGGKGRVVVIKKTTQENSTPKVATRQEHYNTEGDNKENPRKLQPRLDTKESNQESKIRSAILPPSTSDFDSCDDNTIRNLNTISNKSSSLDDDNEADQLSSLSQSPTQKTQDIKPLMTEDVLLSEQDKKKKIIKLQKEKSEAGIAHEYTPAKKVEKERRTQGNKISVTQVMMSGYGDETSGKRRSIASIKRAKEKRLKQRQGAADNQQIFIKREVKIPDVITVQELANRMAEKSSTLIKMLMNLGMMTTVTQTIDTDTAELLVTELGHAPKRTTNAEIERVLISKIDDQASDLVFRPPVVTIMGHVDHGKTSLLDALRETDVVAKEHGGITQHIGAFQVLTQSKKSITFLDTPGHEAFTAMRMRGAQVTDIVVLVVAADDGIMEQTKEAISHAKAAEVPIIVAINKIDKEGANTKKVRSELIANGVLTEDVGGDVMVVEVSAKNKINLEKLEDIILLQAEMLELKANPKRAAEGFVLESRIDKSKGPVANIIVQHGTLSRGDYVIAGPVHGKMRALINDKGVRVKSVGPSSPVEILGLTSAPSAGDEFIVLQDEKVGKELANLRQQTKIAKENTERRKLSLENMFKNASQSAVKKLVVLVKSDVIGSAEAISSSLKKLSNEYVILNIIHSGVGAITESDITLAGASGAIILGFNVRADANARAAAKKNAVDIRYYSIIYRVIEDIKLALDGMLDPEIKEVFLGYAQIRKVFNITRHGKIAGCYVTEGLIKRNCAIRLLRDNVIIHEGALKSLKKGKEDTQEAKNGFECGIAFENYEDIKEGDVIESFEMVETKRVITPS